jgi:hypothetical protein
MYGGIAPEGKMEYSEKPIRRYEKKFGIRGSQIGHPQGTSRMRPLLQEARLLYEGEKRLES